MKAIHVNHFGAKTTMTKSAIRVKYLKQNSAAQKVLAYFRGPWRLRDEAKGAPAI
jgi:hypothetical protein